MRRSLMCVLMMGALLLGNTVIWAVDAAPGSPGQIRNVSRDLEHYVTPDGRIDLQALKASGYQGPLKLDGTEIRIDPMTGEPVVQPSAASDPDERMLSPPGTVLPGRPSGQDWMAGRSR